MYLPLPIVVGYFWPKFIAFYIVCGVLDVLRTRPRNRATIVRYFMGRGFGTWLLSPFNLLVDVLHVPLIATKASTSSKTCRPRTRRKSAP